MEYLKKYQYAYLWLFIIIDALILIAEFNHSPIEKMLSLESNAAIIVGVGCILLQRFVYFLIKSPTKKRHLSVIAFKIITTVSILYYIIRLLFFIDSGSFIEDYD